MHAEVRLGREIVVYPGEFRVQIAENVIALACT